MFRKWLKRIFIFLASIIFLAIALLIFLHTSWGKSIVRNKVQKYLRNKLETTVSIGKIDYSLPNWIKLENLVILDRRKDTLLAGGSFYVKLNMLKLLSQNVEIDGVKLENIKLQIEREINDPTFNYQFIADAFSSPSKQPDTSTASKPMKLSVNYISLDNVGLIFNDKKDGKYFSADVHHFFCVPHYLDLGKPSIEINNLLVSGCKITLIDSAAADNKSIVENKTQEIYPKAESKSSPFLLALKKLGLRNIEISFKKPLAKTNFSASLDSMQLDETSIDAQQNFISSQKFTLMNSAVNFYAWVKPTKTTAKEEVKIKQAASENNWKLSVDEFSLSNNSFIYHNQAIPAVKGFDYNHLEAKQIYFTSKQNKLSSDGFETEITNFSTVVNDQLNLKTFKTGATYTDSFLSIKNFALALNESNLTTTGDLVWRFKPTAGSNADNLSCTINSTISYADVLQFQPALSKSLPVSLSPSDKIFVSGNLKGSLQNFTMDNCRLSNSSNTFRFAGNLSVQNGPKEVRYDADINQLQLQKRLLSPGLLRQLEKQNLNLPVNISASGKINGTSTDVSANLKMNSSYGGLHINGVAANINQTEKLQYQLQLDADNFETGKWIHQDSLLGKLTGKIFLKGIGIDPNNISAKASLQLKSFSFNRYNYSNINLDALYAANNFTVKGDVNDPNLTTKFDLHGKLMQPYPAAAGYIDIQHADLRKLQYTRDSICLSGKIKISSDHPGADTNKFLATITIDSSIVVYNKKNISLDSLLISSYSERDSTQVAIEAPFVNAELNSNCSLKQLPTAIENILQHLYASKIGNQVNSENQKLSFHGSLIPHPILSSLVPEFNFTGPIDFISAYNPQQGDSVFYFKLNAPSFRYSGIGVDQFDVHAHKIDSTLFFAINTNSIQSGTDSVFQTSIAGEFHNNLLTASLLAKDNKGAARFAVKTTVLNVKDSIDIKFLGDLIINRNKWEVADDNRIAIVKDGFIVNNLSLSNRGQTIYVASKDPQCISPINIRIDSFEIGNVLRILSFGDSTLARGKLSADITIDQPINKFPLIAGTIGVKNASVQNIPVGDLKIFSETKGDSLIVSGNISGKTQANFDGSINSTTDNMRLGLQLQKLDVSLIQPFLKDYISRTSGNCSAELNFSGATKDPKCNGRIHFDSTAFAINNFFVLYKMNEQSISINYPDIIFNQFTFSDSLNNKFAVDGKIKVISPEEYGLDLKVDTKNLVVMNAPRQRSSEFYGKAIISADLKIGGTSNEPTIEGNGLLQNKSSIHYLLSQSNSYSNKEQGLVQFVDFDTLYSPEQEMHQLTTDSLVARKTFKGLNYNLNLGIDKEAEFSIIIDPTTNDELFVKGEGQVNVGIGEGGAMGITGLYELKSGYYKMNNQILKGKFVLMPGSIISFNGDPNNAQADVKTQYEVKTTVSGLLNEDETSSSSSQRIPFLVILKIKGPLSKPEFSFDILINEKTASINSQLRIAIEDELDKLRTNVSEMNKQAFSLLVMNHFTVTEGGNLSSTNVNPDVALRQGMSYFLSAAMNEAAGSLIKGVDIDVNLNNYKTDNSSSSNTDVEVTISKKMFNDRMIVTVGENVLIGNSNATNAQQYVPDVTSTYKLSRDGRYQVKAYLKNEYDAVVEGYFSETGVSFVIEMDYNKLKEMFQHTKTTQNH